MDSPISISFSVSDNYSQHLAVVLTSVLLNNPESRFMSNVSHHNITKANQARMYGDCDVRFRLTVDSQFAKFLMPAALEHVTKEMYYRYILPEVLADEIRTIYSDVDVRVGRAAPLAWSSTTVLQRGFDRRGYYSANDKSKG